jgi:hypothetical protein
MTLYRVADAQSGKQRWPRDAFAAEELSKDLARLTGLSVKSLIAYRRD